MIEFHFFFWNANKNFRVAGKNYGRSVNWKQTYFFWPKLNMNKLSLEPRHEKICFLYM